MTPTPPPTLTDLEAHIFASECPAVVLAERSAIRDLITYLRSLEADVVRLKACKRQTVFVEEGSFW
jgi:hypothetical protein